ncbi:hypothetical protein SAMN05661091_4113 [Paenibacillus uliginis N3/975]|uniref:Uncharacterized protein n=1 Tax=Paenibacillus uliginis N3/975 TaxID=1313296 RepID=A0A1X7HK89_9BACL|nr:hypothetical protein SAMN05661091_4113 [Paenibacillus uliginis N3/975]
MQKSEADISLEDYLKMLTNKGIDVSEVNTYLDNLIFSSVSKQLLKD